ncbi:hypothetical protein CEXT_80681 [Caerostris extrusa]|uniref:Uncharacterized protein n=1 Tax=Caerostris extrusa TaxID=172846 RepID=A0AAV4QIT2_CAEEX|nr:hypothetical protein CEXT_80681 [Caerostris extrusa]
MSKAPIESEFMCIDCYGMEEKRLIFGEVHSFYHRKPGVKFFCFNCRKYATEATRIKIYDRWTTKPFQCMECDSHFRSKHKLLHHVQHVCKLE